MNCRKTAYGTLRNGFDALPSALLREILEETGARIVVSGALGRTVSFEELKVYFEQVGISGNLVIDVTPYIGRRGDDISHWLHEHPDDVTCYIVIDDAGPEHVAPHENCLVHTAWETGMTRAHANRAITLLNQQRHP